MYGVPDSTIESWAYNLDIVSQYDIKHISSYALTLEPKTALESFVRKLIIDMPDEGLVYEEGCLKCVSCGYSKCG